jgi:dipeptidyl aminopeptidase/acylaminoacyl peptidase
MLALGVAGCSGQTQPTAAGTSSSSSAAASQNSATSLASASDAETSPASASVPAASTARTLQTLIDLPQESPTLTVVEALPPGEGYTSAVVSYESEGLTIYGTLHTPSGEGPFLGVVFVHGAVDPDSWSAQTEYVDEQARLAVSGRVVLVPDLRNHGDSDDDPDWQYGLEMGTTLDVVNASRALGALDGVSAVGVVGHSLGGAITLNTAVVAPDVATAFVALAPSNSSPWENVQHFAAGTPYLDELTALRGTPQDNPAFWTDVTSTTFAERATSPLLIVQGSADDVVPVAWSASTDDAFTAAGADVELVVVDGGDHLFDPVEDQAWASVLDFLQEHGG